MSMRRKQGNNETGYARHGHKYTRIEQVPNSTILTIRKAIAGGWVNKQSDNSKFTATRINKLYPEISPHCIQQILRMYKSEINISDNDLNIDSPDSSRVLIGDNLEGK